MGSAGRRAPVRAVALCGLVLGGLASCGSPASEGGEPPAPTELPTASISLGTGAVEVLSTATDLFRESYVVARGRFVGGPTVVHTTPDGEELAGSLVVWEFVADEGYRDVRTADAPSRLAEERRGSILVAAGVNEVGRMRGEEPVEDFVRSFTSVYNLNSVPVDTPLHVFLRPGTMPRDAVARDPELGPVMTLVESTHCYAVDDLRRSCTYVADAPGGEPLAALAEGDLVPSGLTLDAIEAAGSVTEVVDSGYYTDADPIDAGRYTPTFGGGGEADRGAGGARTNDPGTVRTAVSDRGLPSARVLTGAGAQLTSRGTA